ncbi:inosose isomerase [Novipirellula caenicola]|uniref:Inosose isomerase n=1 Tax=Novipirellula caenicola TaxID=1536901 RepID=A0ABP9VYC1_9BACT
MTDRREFMGLVTASAVGLAVTGNLETASATEVGSTHEKKSPVRFALNMSTLRGQNLTITQQIEVAAKAGYDGVEPWIRDLEAYVKNGGSVADLRKQIEDAGMTVDSAIGFANWISDDAEQRKAGLEVARRDMELVRSIGGAMIAAPPIGAHQKDAISPPLPVIAERYRALLQLGDEIGVTPQLELWGFSPTLSKLGELAYVATAAEHPKACVLPDFYHIYKGGSDFAGLGMIEASRMHCFHINDYPGEPSQRDISDKDRVFPGDGVCPLVPTIRQLLGNGFRGTFSLELFNPEYWKRDALEVAREGLEKSKRVVADAIVEA